MLTKEQVTEIRTAYARGDVTLFDIAKRMELGTTTVWRAIQGEKITRGRPETSTIRITHIVRRVRRMVNRWIRIRETPSTTPGVWAQIVSAGGPEATLGSDTNRPASRGPGSHVQTVRVGAGNPYIQPYTPSDQLCWVLTFEIMLKALSASEYRALAAWYRGNGPPNTTALYAIKKIDAERARRHFR